MIDFKKLLDYNYYVSKEGKIYNSKGKQLKTRINTTGSEMVTLYKKRRPHYRVVAVLVAEAFLRRRKNKTRVLHLDFDKTNNRVDNLMWASQQDIVKYSSDHGRMIGNRSKSGSISRIKLSKSVVQYNMDKVYMKTFYNAYDASKELNISQSTINRCCNYKLASAGGYIWRFEDESKTLSS